MNLETLAERACLESGYNDASDVAAAKKFARHWDEHIWNAALWKDSLAEYRVTLDPDGYTPGSNYIPSKGVLLLPKDMDRVIGVRTADNQVLIEAQESFYRMDYDVFAQEGKPLRFAMLEPAVWEVDGPEDFLLHRFDAGDSNSTVEGQVIATNGVDEAAASATAVDLLTSLATADRVARLHKAATTGSMALSVFGENLLPATFQRQNVNKAGIDLTVEVGALYEWTQNIDQYLSGSPYLATDPVDYLPQWTPPTYGWSIPGITPGSFLFYAEATTLSVVVLYGTVGMACPSVLRKLHDCVTVGAADTAFPVRNRLRVFGIPQDAVELRILGKRKHRDLTHDQQEPALRNLTPSLVAFIRASLKRRGQEHGAAQQEFQEANALLKQVMQIEAVQAANHNRFTPEAGYGPEYGLGPL